MEIIGAGVGSDARSTGKNEGSGVNVHRRYAFWRERAERERGGKRGGRGGDEVVDGYSERERGGIEQTNGISGDGTGDLLESVTRSNSCILLL